VLWSVAMRQRTSSWHSQTSTWRWTAMPAAVARAAGGRWRGRPAGGRLAQATALRHRHPVRARARLQPGKEARGRPEPAAAGTAAQGTAHRWA